MCTRSLKTIEALKKSIADMADSPGKEVAIKYHVKQGKDKAYFNRDEGVYKKLLASKGLSDLYASMKPTWTPGGDIQQPYVDLHQPVEPLQSYFLLISLLQQIHGAGIVHCDVKPQHVRNALKSPNNILLIDFDQAMLSISTEKNMGYTCAFVSVDRLVNRGSHPLDDLEAACWVALAWHGEKYVDLTVSSNSQSQVLIQSLHRMGRVVSFLSTKIKMEQNNITHLYQRLLYLWTVPRKNGIWVDIAVYKNLLDPHFVFPVADFLQQMSTHGKIVRSSFVKKTQGEHKTDGMVMEEIVADQLNRFYDKVPGLVPDQNFNQVYKSKENTDLTELDIIFTDPCLDGLPLLPKREFVKGLPNYVEGIVGSFVVWETFSTMKNLSDISKKLALLPADYRPIHLLFFFSSFVFIGKGFSHVTKHKKKKKRSIEECLFSVKDIYERLLKVFSNKYWEWGVLIAAGRLVCIYNDNLCVVAVTKWASITISDFEKKLKKVEVDKQNIEMKLKREQEGKQRVETEKVVIQKSLKKEQEEKKKIEKSLKLEQEDKKKIEKSLKLELNKEQEERKKLECALRDAELQLTLLKLNKESSK